MKLLCSIFCLLMASLAMAASPQPNLGKSIVQLQEVNDNSALTISKLEAQISELKLQNQMIQTYQDKMSATVYWALGVVAGIFALLMSYSVFTNFRFYEQDKKKIKEELRVVMEIFKSELLVRFEQDRGDLERSLESRTESHVNIILQQGAESRAKIDSVRTELLESVDATKKKQEAIVESIVSVRKLTSIQAAQFFAVEEMVWGLKDNPSCIIITQSQALDAALSVESDYFISAVLKRLSATLTKYYIEGVRGLGSSELKTINEMVEQVGQREPQLIHEIRQKLTICTLEKEEAL